MTSFELKIVALISMLCDHTGLVFLGSPTYFNVIGRIAFPIFAFQISEGYTHTKNLKKYILRLIIFALTSQLPFVLFRNSVELTSFSLNIFFTLLLGLLSITIYDKCKSEEPDSFANVTLQIKDNLGTKYNHLTENVLKPLSTAEFLYNNYVVSRKIEDFDYSGISALYYQSLEALFNEIIWKPYAEKLNHLNTNRNGSFYQIYSSDEDIPKEYIGYLPKYNRSYYIDSKNKQITTHLNPGSCYHIINDAYNNKHLTHWNHHLLETFGLKEVTVDFITAIYDIANKMSTYDNRNQASHGGNTIDSDQCYLDKVIVYSSDGTSTGIINKILNLFIV